jgi:hypothetical protein
VQHLRSPNLLNPIAYLTHMAKRRIQTSSTKTKKNKVKAPDKISQPVHKNQRDWFYQKNKKLLEHSVNKTFEDILWMSEKEFKSWMIEMRKAVVQLWDNEGLPPTVGLDENEIIAQFEDIAPFPVASFLTEQAGKNRHCVILNTSKIGMAANQWFPTMMKTKINYTSDLKAGLSIYDHFKERHLLEKMITYGRRHFKKDSFYHYSHVVPFKAEDLKTYLFKCKSGREWIQRFEAQSSELRKRFDYWLSPKDEEAKYTGYDDKLRKLKPLTLSQQDIEELPIPQRCLKNISTDNKTTTYQIRVFEKGQRLFPIGFKAFRVSLCQYAVNFPPLTAKFIYERYIQKLGVKEAIIWDPSSGWGGRILGAMGLRKEFKVHYIGTDPNTDHNTSGRRTKYHELADFYNEVRTGKRRSIKRRRRILNETNTYEIYQCGSEEMSKQKGFQKFRGKIDIVFTSPPYFGKELYSEDAKQSARKFDEYAAWRDGFLQPTLKTAVEWLRPGGYLLWNIANIKLGKKQMPLEGDSCAILKELGMQRIEVLKMGLANMPGANRMETSNQSIEESYNDVDGLKYRITKRGKIKAPHGVWIKTEDNKERPTKYEPIFVYQKPLNKQHKDSAQVEPDPIDAVADLADDFNRVVSSKKINPIWLRFIYATLEQRTAGKVGAEYFRHYNRLNKKTYFISLKQVASKDIPQFVQRDIANQPSKRLAGENVLVQFIKKNEKGKLERYFSHAVVLKPEFGDEPQNIRVQVSSNKQCAERCCGLTIVVKRNDVLRISVKPSPFQYLKGQWSYSSKKKER